LLTGTTTAQTASLNVVSTAVSALGTAITGKANSADVFLKTATYSRTQAEALFTPKIDTYTSPLRLVIDPISFASDLRIDPQLDLNIRNITATGNLTVDTIDLPQSASELTIAGDCAVNGALYVDEMRTNVANFLTIHDHVTMIGNLQVDGNVTIHGTTSFANPYWVAVVINFVGGVPTIVRNGGRYAATSLIRVSAQPTGIVQFDFPAHPQGTNYIISVNVSAGYGTIMTSIRTNTRCGISIRNISNVLFDTEAHVLILAY
jgi:hypothetical protein